jgi:two-component system, LytTR family, sensor kinase
MIKLNLNSRQKNIFVHIIWWILYVLIVNFLLYIDKPIQTFLIRSLLTYPIIIAVFYINAHFVIERYWAKGLYYQHIFFSLLLLAAYTLCRYLLVVYVLKSYSQYSETLFYEKFFLDTLWIALQFFLYSYGYWFALHRIRLEKDKQILSNKLLMLEKMRIETELKFLQAQINPHFLFNTFNFLYAEAIKTSPKLADSVMSLTVMMRHIIELSHDKLIPLNKEIDYIKNYIKIQQYRFDTQLNLTFEIQGEDLARFYKVPPLVFISIIENCFKYGDFSDTDTPAIIEFDITHDQVRFFTYNLKRKHFTQQYSSGIGVKNISAQLKHIFGERHSLKIKDEPNDYSIEIIIFNGYLTNNNE